MHHGTACVVGETEWTGTLAHLRLERACALLTWCRTAHRPHSQHGEYTSLLLYGNSILFLTTYIVIA